MFPDLPIFRAAVHTTRGIDHWIDRDGRLMEMWDDTVPRWCVSEDVPVAAVEVSSLVHDPESDAGEIS
jgi:hypothetical protein